MRSSESGSTAGQLAMNQASTTAPMAPGESRPRSHRQIWAIALGAGVAAGLIAWLAGELAHGFFRPRLYKVEVMGLGMTMQPSRESQAAADLTNATLAFAILGGVTGLAMGFAGGLADRSPARNDPPPTPLHPRSLQASTARSRDDVSLSGTDPRPRPGCFGETAVLRPHRR